MLISVEERAIATAPATAAEIPTKANTNTNLCEGIPVSGERSKLPPCYRLRRSRRFASEQECHADGQKAGDGNYQNLGAVEAFNNMQHGHLMVPPNALNRSSY